MVFAAAPDSAPVRSGDESAGHKGDDFLKQALQYGVEDDNIAAAKEESELTHERVLKFLKSSVSILVGLVFVGVLYCTVRLRWPVSYAFYWTMVTALTVGYGDSPTCDIVVNTTDDDGAPEGTCKCVRGVFFFFVYGFDGKAQESLHSLDLNEWALYLSPTKTPPTSFPRTLLKC